MCPRGGDLCRLQVLAEAGQHGAERHDAGVRAGGGRATRNGGAGTAERRNGLEIRLPFGRTVVVAPDFDEAVLARVIRALEQIPC